MFAQYEYLYLLLFIPLFFLFFLLRLRAGDRLLRSYIHDSCLKVVADVSFRRRRILRYSFLLMVFLFLILALARPQSQKEKQEVEIKGAEVMILVDVSKSMLVKDMNGFSRLNVMKKELDKLIKMLSGQRVGLISFAGSAVLVSPLTLDHSLLRLFLKSLSPEEAVLPGTDFGGAFRSAAQALKRGSALAPTSSSRVIVIASDGEDNEEATLETVKELANRKLRIFTLGFGTGQGGMIPEYDRQGNKIAYKKDQSGNPVISRFNEKNLKEISRITGGAFYTVSPGGNTIEKVYAAIREVGTGVSSYQSQTVYKEWYQYYLLAALFFGFLYFLTGERRKNYLQEWHSYIRRES